MIFLVKKQEGFKENKRATIDLFYIFQIWKIFMGMSSTEISKEMVAIQIAKALSNPTRLQILLYLHQNKCAMVSSFTRMLKIPASDASKSLKILRACGLVQREKFGKRMVHTLNQDLWKVVQDLITVSS